MDKLRIKYTCARMGFILSFQHHYIATKKMNESNSKLCVRKNVELLGRISRKNNKTTMFKLACV